MQDKSTLAQTEPLERIVFQVPASFKLAVDLEIKRRRSTIRKEGTAALAQYLGIPLPESIDADEDLDEPKAKGAR